HGAADRAHRATELHQHAVAHHLDDAAVMLSNKRYQNTRPMLLQYRERPRFVPLNESAITDHVGCEDGGQAPLHAFFGHAIGSPLENAVPPIVLGVHGDVYDPALPLRVTKGSD